MATLALSLLAAAYFFMGPVRTILPPTPGDAVALFTFAVVGLGIAWLAHSQRRAVQLAAAETVLRRDAEARSRPSGSSSRSPSIASATPSSPPARTGRITLVNDVAKRLLRGDAAQVLGRPMDEVFRIVNESTRQPVESPVAKVLREGGSWGLANHTVLIALDGTETPIDDSAAPIRNDRGEVVGAVLVFRDITERRKSERAAAFLEALVASSDDAIVGKSLDGIVQTWNDGAERLYGYRAARDRRPPRPRADPARPRARGIRHSRAPPRRRACRPHGDRAPAEGRLAGRCVADPFAQCGIRRAR